MRYLVVGAGGLLGSTFADMLPADDVVTAGREQVPLSLPALERLVEEAAADVVINCAAHTDVDGAERDPDPAFAVNAMLPSLLGQVCRRRGARIVHFSSTGCYGKDLDRPYTEEHPLRPTTVHHRSKASGEDRLRETGCEALILRTGWLYGGRTPKPRNFVRARLAEAKGKAMMTSDATQFGNPTWVDDVVRQTLLLIEQGMSGTFNCVAGGAASRFDYVSHIVARSGWPCRVEPSTTPFVRAAAVSPNEAALNYRLGLLGLDQMASWTDALDRYLGEVREWPEWRDLLP